MKKDKVKLYILEFIFLVILFIALFVSSNISRLVLSIALFLGAFITRTLFKKKKIISMYSKSAMILMIAFGLLYVGIFYLLGLLFYDFNRQMILFNFSTLTHFIIPYTVIVISSEVIRFTLLSQDGKIRIRNTNFDYSKIIAFLLMVLIDLVIYIGVYDLAQLNDFLALIGFISFSSISCNLFYNYYSKRFGFTGIVIYRLITILYIYFIPIIPNMYVYFRSFLRMLYPYILYLIIDYIFGSSLQIESFSTRRKNAIVITSLIVFMSLITMLISCQFRFGVLVVGSDSMRGSLNRGDATIYESYSKQVIKPGDVIIFDYDNLKLIHRITEIQNVNGETRFYTKGDANKNLDPEYRLESDVIGISRLRVPYVGIPTLWLRSLFR